MNTPPVERRVAGGSGFAALMEMVIETNANVSHLRQEISDGALAQKLAIESVLADAFPEGDPVGHRKAHEAAIKSAEDKAIFWKTMLTKLTEWGLIGFAGWAVYSLWAAFLQGPHK
jgi:hypothetical protein